MAGERLSYKFSESIILGKNCPTFSRSFIRFGTGIDEASTTAFTESRETMLAGNYHVAKQRSKPDQEATW